MKLPVFLFSFLLLLINHEAKAANILGFFPSPSRSHFITENAVMLGLADKGHNVTVVSSFPVNKPKSNYRHILINIAEETNEIDKMMENMLNDAEKSHNFFLHIPNIIQISMERNNMTLNDPQVQKLMNEETFDLLIIGWFGNEFHLGIGAHFKCPIIIISPNTQLASIRALVGNPHSVSNVPHALMNLPIRMSFTDRILNMLASILENTVNWYLYSLNEQYYSINFPSDRYPSFEYMMKNVSLAFINYHFSQGVIQPNVPAMIEIGGIQIKSKPDRLPENLRLFLDLATDGVILFSLGSNLKSSMLPPEKLNDILSVFSKLKQRVIWKWEDDQLANKPINVYISKWLPQDDILAHPNTILFISHCGLGSIVESKYHAKPILGIPIFGDQMSNLESIVKEGWAIELLYSELTATRLENSINEILTNKSYTIRAKEVSNLYRDRPQTAMETAVFWVEYVLRHNGAKHLQSPAVHQNFIQNHSIDIIAFFTLLTYLVIKLFKFIFYYICCKNNKSKQKLD